MNPVDDVIDVLRRKGGKLYGLEAVTQLEHALQCAALAEQEGAPASLVAAALLHDIGHLVNPDDPAAKQRGEDAYHETVAAAYLDKWFMPEVVEPVRWHVAAKRYLTNVDPAYWDGLSAGSKRSLELQGGPFSAEKAAGFAGNRHAAGAVRVRRWDDLGKVRGLKTPDLAHFRPCLEACLKEGAAARG